MCAVPPCSTCANRASASSASHCGSPSGSFSFGGSGSRSSSSPTSVFGGGMTWLRCSSIEAASDSSGRTAGRKTVADSCGARARTTRPTAWAKNSGVR